MIRNDLVITEENVSELIETAEVYSCFENVSRILTDKCVSYVRSRDKEDHKESNEPTGFRSSVLKAVKSWIGGKEVGDSGCGGSQDEGEIVQQCEEVSQSERGDQEDSGLDNSISCRERDRLKMCLKNVCWVNFLKSDTELPADITFKFYEKTETADGREVRKFVGDLKAHKLLLASCSEVFKERFFNSSNLTTTETIIEDCSIRGFKVMVDFIYGRFPRLRDGSVCEIFEIENVAERFRIAGLKEEYKSSMLLYFRDLYKEQQN